MIYIYIYMLCCLHGKAKNKKKFRGGFPECLSCGTRQRGFFKKKQNFFAECLSCGTRQRVFKKNQKSFPSVTLGEENQKKEKKENGVGRRPTASSLPRVPVRHSAKPSPSARFSTLGGVFPVGGLAGGSSLCVALREGFP